MEKYPFLGVGLCTVSPVGGKNSPVCHHKQKLSRFIPENQVMVEGDCVCTYGDPVQAELDYEALWQQHPAEL